MLKTEFVNKPSQSIIGKPKEINGSPLSAKIGNNAALSFYEGGSSPVIQRLTATAIMNRDQKDFKILKLSIEGRADTGFRDGKKRLQGNHTLSDAALDFYQEEMVEGQYLTDVLEFYKHLKNELEEESKMLLSFHKSTPDRFKLFQLKQTSLSQALVSLEQIISAPNVSIDIVRSHFEFLVVCFDEMYAASAYSTDGLEATGGKREKMGMTHLREIENPRVRVELLKLLSLVDFDAIDALNQSGYTTDELLKKTGNFCMGLPFDGSILAPLTVPAATPSASAATPVFSAAPAVPVATDPRNRHVLQNLGNTNPAVTRLLVIAARIQNKHRAGLHNAVPYLDSRLSAVLPEGVPSQSGALVNMSGDMLDAFAATGSISPLLSRPLQPDSSAEELTYPLSSSSAINRAVTNMAVCACNVISHQMLNERTGSSTSDSRRTTRNYVFQYLQGIQLCSYKDFVSDIHDVRNLMNSHDLEQEKELSVAEYCTFYEQVHLMMCRFVSDATFCKVIPESDLSK